MTKALQELMHFRSKYLANQMEPYSVPLLLHVTVTHVHLILAVALT